MNEYTVIWTYVANYGIMTLTAKSAKEAIDSVLRGFSEDFTAKGKVYAFPGRPEATHNTSPWYGM